MDKYSVLKDIVDDYIKYVEKINAKRVEISSKDFNLLMQEVRAFNLLQQNIHALEGSIGVSEN